MGENERDIAPNVATNRSRAEKVQGEYERILVLFEGCDENQLKLVDGAIWECARERVELEQLQGILAECGHVKVNPNKPAMQKELPASKVAIKLRASYLNYIAKLSLILGRNIKEDEEDDLTEFE